VWCKGAEHIYLGKVKVRNYTFDSDPKYPLTFKLDSASKCYVYLCGRGTVTKDGGSPVRLGYNQSARDWLAWLKNGTDLQRQGAAQALGWLGDKKIVPALQEALKDASPEVRRNAAESLGRVTDGALAVAALTAAGQGADEPLAAVAAESLGKLGSPGMAALKDMLPNEKLRLRAIAGLGNSREPEAVLLLAGFVGAKNPKDATAAVEALGKIAQPACFDPLQKALGSGHKEVRSKAVTSLARLKDPRVPAELQKIASGDADQEVRKAAREAVEKLRKAEKQDKPAAATPQPQGDPKK